MKGLFITFLAVASVSFAQAQKGDVTIEQDPKISKLLNIYKDSNANMGYYTIQVGFGSYSEAENLKRDVEIDFPQWRARIIFDSPTYRVRVGQFKTKLEAERNFLEVREKYQQSIIIKSSKDKKS